MDNLIALAQRHMSGGRPERSERANSHTDHQEDVIDLAKAYMEADRSPWEDAADSLGALARRYMTSTDHIPQRIPTELGGRFSPDMDVVDLAAAYIREALPNPTRAEEAPVSPSTEEMDVVELAMDLESNGRGSTVRQETDVVGLARRYMGRRSEKWRDEVVLPLPGADADDVVELARRYMSPGPSSVARSAGPSNDLSDLNEDDLARPEIGSFLVPNRFEPGGVLQTPFDSLFDFFNRPDGPEHPFHYTPGATEPVERFEYPFPYRNRPCATPVYDGTVCLPPRVSPSAPIGSPASLDAASQSIKVTSRPSSASPPSPDEVEFLTRAWAIVLDCEDLFDWACCLLSYGRHQSMR